MADLGAFGAIAGGVTAIVADILLAAFLATAREALRPDRRRETHGRPADRLAGRQLRGHLRLGGGVSLTILVWGRLPVELGWLGIIAAGLLTIAIIGIGRLARRTGGPKQLETFTRPPILVAGSTLAAFVAFPASCVWLGFSL